ncbi:unnamed protein product [Cylindrotheca closterium]|uniref:AB hydrolase-1 domain-containing protein n=1 Tax=Cylindrotheca closterium TaxID=2856 RepID=A0AAD2JNS5_9STRA|nr:unnamed protein product [Cylindrotheca closterium]
MTTKLTTLLVVVYFLGFASSFAVPSIFISGARAKNGQGEYKSPSSSSSSSQSLKPLLATAAKANEGFLTVSRSSSNSSEYQLSYRVVRPMSLSSNQAAPIVTLHGGPSVPSNYLYPLEQIVPYRSIVFWDQLGCGKSDQPQDLSQYSTEDSVQDLILLLQKLGVRRFHLYGQSYGGILAFEFLKYLAESSEDFDFQCLSCILSSAPTNVKEIEQEADRLIGVLQQDNPDATPLELGDLFRLNHQCRVGPDMPPILKEAYDNAGTVWRGTDAIQDYVATAPTSADASRMPSTLIMRGEHDFVSAESVEGWKSVFNTKFLRYKTLEGCSHHGMLEAGAQYGEIVDSYFGEYD